jgi:integrase
VLYDFRHTFATRCAQAGCELPILADLLGHSDITTTMRYVHPAKQQKVAAVERLEKYFKMARQFEDLQEEPKYDEWGQPIPSDESPTQKYPQVIEAGDLSF